MRVQRLLERVSGVILAFLLVWGILSFIEVNNHSLDSGYEYNKLNLFCVLTTHASMEMAEHERSKGIALLPNEEVKEPIITDEMQYEIDLLANIINAEGGGAYYVSDEMCYYIGSVVLNRIESKEFPNTMYGVITQPGQYTRIGSANWNQKITDRSREIAEELYMNGSVLPSNVVFQAQFTQGSGICKQLPIATGGYMYFCYR